MAGFGAKDCAVRYRESSSLPKDSLSIADKEPRDEESEMNTSNQKVLLVEDSKFLRLTNERVLTKAGYEVCTAADGEEALSVAQAKLPDVILLDMMLPKLSGPEVLRRLKANPEPRISRSLCSPAFRRRMKRNFFKKERPRISRNRL